MSSPSSIGASRQDAGGVTNSRLRRIGELHHSCGAPAGVERARDRDVGAARGRGAGSCADGVVQRCITAQVVEDERNRAGDRVAPRIRERDRLPIAFRNDAVAVT